MLVLPGLSKLWVLSLICARVGMAESQVDGTCEADACEDSISLIQQSSSVKRRTNDMETEKEGAAPSDVDLSPLAQAISAAVEQGVNHKEGEGSGGAPEDISVIVSLPTAYPPGSFAVGPTAPPVRGVSEQQMRDYVDAHASGGLTSAQIKADVKMDVQKYIDEQLKGHLRISRGTTGDATGAQTAKNEKIYRSKPGEIIAKTTTTKPGTAGTGGVDGTNPLTAGTGGLNNGQTAAIQAQVQKETQAGIQKGIQAAVMDAQKAIEKQIAAGVQNGIQQGIAAGLAGAGR